MQVISFRAIRCISGKESHVGIKVETTWTQIQYGRCLFSINIKTYSVAGCTGTDISEKLMPTPKERLTLTFLP